MNDVHVYVDPNNRPQHLAIPNEQMQQAQNGDAWRPVCGANPGGLTVKPVPPNEARSNCQECNDQLDMWLDVHG